MNHFEFSQNILISEFSAIFKFVLAKSIEKATHVTLCWLLSRNPDKKRVESLETKDEKNRKFNVHSRKMLTIFG